MNISSLKVLLSVLVLGLATLTASAQTTTTPTRPPMNRLGADLKDIIEQHRDTMKAFQETHKAALEALKNATPAEREALKAALRLLMQQQQQNQRELAKEIRDAIKARRDQQHKGV